MTESEWLDAADPPRMLQYLRASSKASDRQLRLAACAYCRSVWRVLGKASQRAVLLGEQMADEPVEEGHRAAVVRAAVEALYRFEVAGGDYFRAADIACRVANKDGWQAAEWTLGARTDLPTGAPILRDIIGNPFRPPPAISASLLTWREGLACRLAEQAYQHRILPAGTLDPARLAVLADALEEAGCDAADLLGHLRGPGPHWRGCHIVDWLLGRA